MFKSFKEKFKKSPLVHEVVDDVVDDVQKALERLQVSSGSGGHSEPHTPGFVGGFHESYMQSAPSNLGGPPPSFPQPQLNPLPTPPKIRPTYAPDPEVGSSRTMRYARMAEQADLQQANGGLRPPEAQVPHRPYSDPAVAQAEEESISSPPSRPRPVKSSRRASASHVPAAVVGGSPTPRTRRRASSTASSPPSNSAGDDRVQCSGTTKAGKRCTRYCKVGPTVTGMDPDVEGEIKRFCHQHRTEIMSSSGFYVRTQNKDVWVKFEDWIPDYLTQDTQASLREVMQKPISKSDKDGYIYGFEIRDDSVDDRIFLKVGRTVHIVKRMDEWSKQCGSKEQVLRGYWPSGLDDDEGPMMRGMVAPGPPGPFCYRLERLVHLELGDISVNTPYLHKDFPKKTAALGTSDVPRNDRKKVRCPDCHKFHQEIFPFVRPTKGPYEGKEWELLVKPVIEKWGSFLEAFYLNQA